MSYYIIEHHTRGTLREIDHDGDKPIFRFSWSGKRNDPDSAMQFPTLTQAKKTLVAMPEKLKSQCIIMKSLDPDMWKGQSWIRIDAYSEEEIS